MKRTLYKRQERIKILLNIFLVILSAAVILLTLKLTMEVLEERDKTTTAAFISNIVDSALEEAIARPVQTARSMACNSFLRHYVESYEEESEQEFEATLCEYLKELKDNSDCSKVYFTNAHNNRYYSDAGFVKILDFYEGSYDEWYRDFLNTKNDFDIDIEHDILNSDIWTVFVDYRMEEESGELLGVCTVGLQMDFLRDLIENMCKVYNVSVVMTNDAGIVEIAAGEVQPYEVGEQVDLDSVLENESKVINEIHTSVSDISLMNWNLLIFNSSNPYMDAIARYIYVLFGVVVVLIYSIMLYASITVFAMGRKIENDSVIDKSTGLLTKKGYEDMIVPFFDVKDWTQFIFHIDGLDSSMMDMETYQEELSRIAKVLKRTFRGTDIIGNTDPNTFCVFCNSNLEDVTINKKIEKVTEAVEQADSQMDDAAVCELRVRTSVEKGSI